MEQQRSDAANRASRLHALLATSGVGDWCAPGPAATQKRQWLLWFEDQDMGVSVFDDEAEALESFARHESGGWNCHLFAHVPRQVAN